MVSTFEAVMARANFQELPKIEVDALGGARTFVGLVGAVDQQLDLRLAVARALVKVDEAHRRKLRDLGLLTRDARAVERKKPGRPKARRPPQGAATTR